MQFRYLLVVLGFFVGVAPASADSLREAAARAVIAQPAKRPTQMISKPMFWSGLSMLAAGGTIATLSASALKKEYCAAAVVGFTAVAVCDQETNKALLWTGIGAAGGGATLMMLGARQVAIQVRPGRVSVERTLSW